MKSRVVKYSICVLVAILTIPLSCSIQRKTRILTEESVSARLKLYEDDDENLIPLDTLKKEVRDTLRVTGLNGEQMFLMKAIRDEDGEMTAHEILREAVVVARSRNNAERHGFVDLKFQVVVPKEMHDSKWQLRFFPDLYIQGDSTRLEPVVITGKNYRAAQLRGYQRYERFVNSIVSDTTIFVNAWQLELFLQRNLPKLYQFKTDTTEVSDEEFASVFGVTEKQAIDHYTNQFARRMNNRRKARLDKMYAKFVKAPIIRKGIRLDTVIQSMDGDFVYNYTQNLSTRPNIRKATIVLRGEVWESNRKVFAMQPTEPLVFYISSLSSFVEEKVRYLTEVVERRAEANLTCHIDFASGKADMDENLSDNRAEISRIKERLALLIEDAEFDLDSIVVTASASPEGSVSLNTDLSHRRSVSVCSYFEDYISHFRDSLESEKGILLDEHGNVVTGETGPEIALIARNGGENWKMLDDFVRSDTLMTDQQKKHYNRQRNTVRNLDALETGLRNQQYYTHLRRDIYPKLRTVVFDFHLHRKGMVKDTIHTTRIDSVYAEGLEALRTRYYERAAELLRPYADFNAAVALLATDHNLSALEIFEKLEDNAEILYLKALLYSRIGHIQEAVQCYMNACELNPVYIHRGNLDPEISALISLYRLNQQEE